MKLNIRNRFEVFLVSNNKLLAEAQSLRHKIFFGSNGKDKDKFDKYCIHLVVVDKNIRKAVGTYRLLLGSVAKKNLGFYSEGEFDLRNIKKNCKGEILEMGRACVDNFYRRFPIINLMWKEIISFIAKNKVKYVFGCASITDPSPEKIGKLLMYFKKRHFSPVKFKAYPLKGKGYPYIINNDYLKSDEEKEILKHIPSLVYGYLKMGAFVCSEPVWDKEFNTADFFMLLDTSKMDAFYKSKFL
jgi:putative hemolysin